MFFSQIERQEYDLVHVSRGWEHCTRDGPEKKSTLLDIYHLLQAANRILCVNWQLLDQLIKSCQEYGVSVLDDRVIDYAKKDLFECLE